MATPRPVRALQFWLVYYRRTWRGGLVVGVAEPVLFLAAMGLGLGHLVAANHTTLDGVRYLAYLAPGLLAATAMQAAVAETTWPVLGSIKWTRSYFAMLATPLRVGDVLAGHALWVALRLTLVATTFLGVMAAFGTVHSWTALALIPVGVLTGLAFGLPCMALAARVERESAFSMVYRFGAIPLFLFSGTFFPVSQLPAGIRPVAYLTPLWHGVTLCRDLDLGRGSAGGTAAHVAVLVGFAAVGGAAAKLTYRRRLAR